MRTIEVSYGYEMDMALRVRLGSEVYGKMTSLPAAPDADIPLYPMRTWWLFQDPFAAFPDSRLPMSSWAGISGAFLLRSQAAPPPGKSGFCSRLR